MIVRPRLAFALTRVLDGGLLSRQGRRAIIRGCHFFSKENPKGFGRFTRENKNPVPNQEEPPATPEPEPKPKEPEAQPQSHEEKQQKIREEIEEMEKEKKEWAQKKSDKSIKIKVTSSKSDDKENPNPGGPQPPQNSSDSNKLFVFAAGFILLILIIKAIDENMQRQPTTIDDFFTQFVANLAVDDLVINRTIEKGIPIIVIHFTPVNGPSKGLNFELHIKNLDHFLAQLKEKSPNKEIRVSFNYLFMNKVSELMNSSFTNSIINILLTTLIFLFFRSMLRQMSKIGNQNKFDEKNSNFMKRLKNDVLKKGSGTNLTFADVAGMDEAKKEITEFVDFLTNKDQYIKLGAKIPKGALLTGPPGTGKTLLAKACANESKVPFISVPGSEFVEIYAGVGASRVRALFEVAKQHAPCIIFIDEIDAIGKKRSGSAGLGGNEERENTLNQLLVEMDGFGSQTNVIVFAATNMKDSLDPALLRPGRFDRLIDVPLPDLEARKKIFLIHLQKITLSPSKSIEDYAKRLASLTPSFSGAQIENVCNEAAIIAARREGESVEQAELDRAVERVIAGLEKKNKADAEARRLVAVHESGHGVVSWFLKNGPPLLKLTIIPRSKGSKGFAQYLTGESMLSTKQDLLDSMCIAMAGTLAEDIILGQRSVGAVDDLAKVQSIAHKIVTTFGMSETGPIRFFENNWGYKSYSEESTFDLDNEKLRIVQHCEALTRKLIEEKKDLILALTSKLLEKETLNYKEIRDILGERPFAPKGNFKAYLEETAGDHHDPEQPPQQTGGPLAIPLERNAK